MNRALLLVSHVSEFGGAERVLLNLGAALARRGYKVILCAPVGELMDMASREQGLCCVEIPAVARKDVSGALAHIISVIKANIIIYRAVLRDYGIRAIVINAPRAGVYFFPVLMCFFKVNRLSLAHDVVGRKSPDYFFSLWMRRIRVQILPVSEAIANSLDISKKQVLPNPVFCRRFFGGRRAHRFVKLGIITNIAEWKGHLLALDAISPLLNMDHDLSYEVYGKVLDMNEEPYFQRLLQKLNKIPNCRFAGYAEDPQNAYSRIDVVIQSSLRSEQPLTLSEAISAGCHIVSPSKGGEVEVIRCWPEATWFERGDVESLRNAIVKAIDRVRTRGVIVTHRDYMRWLGEHTEENWINHFLSFLDLKNDG